MTDVEPDAPAELIPLLEPAEGVPEVTATAAGLDEVVARMAAGSGPVAVDAERASGYRYGQHAYLVQLRRAGAGTALIDPRELPDLSELSAALDGVEWVLHAANQDLPCLAELRFTPSRLFDTELAGRLLGRDRVGLGPMVAAELGFALAKEHSAADWSERPLPQSWLRYAALDVEVLVELRDALAADLTRTGKVEWAEQEFEAVRTAPPPPPRTDPWRRTSGTHLVRDARGLAIVRELWHAREIAAERADISPGRILPDAAIVAAAQAKPRDRAALAELRPFKSRGAARRLSIWADAVARALALEPGELPAKRTPLGDTLPPPRAWRDRNPEGAVRLENVRQDVRALAEELQLPQENLLTPEFQRRISWAPPRRVTVETVADALTDLGARRWQVDLVAEPIARALVAPPRPREPTATSQPSEPAGPGT
ncbi:ribonuclease D [Occultella glacieicola]|uniref:Ribonuclease D n=1 Tax=Occultella glacieicola TaxID=2518684 RepID=A0ABY2DZW6_9MICO|nr:HRDC domain-containing protein [Occultella glacieicola]TDE88908.1 ribonuclease D [Occultella glacieicola]